jgi:hypothetical protein
MAGMEMEAMATVASRVVRIADMDVSFGNAMNIRRPAGIAGCHEMSGVS